MINKLKSLLFINNDKKETIVLNYKHYRLLKKINKLKYNNKYNFIIIINDYNIIHLKLDFLILKPYINKKLIILNHQSNKFLNNKYLNESYVINNFFIIKYKVTINNKNYYLNKKIKDDIRLYKYILKLNQKKDFNYKIIEIIDKYKNNNFDIYNKKNKKIKSLISLNFLSDYYNVRIYSYNNINKINL